MPDPTDEDLEAAFTLADIDLSGEEGGEWGLAVKLGGFCLLGCCLCC